MAGDDVRVDGQSQGPEAGVERLLPDRLVPGDQRVAAPDVVHQHVEPALLGVDPGDQVADLLGHQVVDLNGDAGAAGRGDQLGGLLDGLRPVHLGAAGPGAATGGVDGGAGRAELNGDLPPGARVAPATSAIFPVSGCVMPATLSGIPDNRRPNSLLDLVDQSDPDPAVGPALALHLDHLHLADLGGGGDVGAAVGLHVQPDDVDDPDLLLVRRDEVGLGTDDVRQGQRLGRAAAPGWRPSGRRPPRR